MTERQKDGKIERQKDGKTERRKTKDERIISFSFSFSEIESYKDTICKMLHKHHMVKTFQESFILISLKFNCILIPKVQLKEIKYRRKRVMKKYGETERQ